MAVELNSIATIISFVGQPDRDKFAEIGRIITALTDNAAKTRPPLPTPAPPTNTGTLIFINVICIVSYLF